MNEQSLLVQRSKHVRSLVRPENIGWTQLTCRNAEKPLEGESRLWSGCLLTSFDALEFDKPRSWLSLTSSMLGELASL